MEEKDTLKTESKVKKFVKKNAYYLALIGIVVMLGLVIGLTAGLSGNPAQEPDVPTNVDTIQFVCPVSNATISKGYSATELQYNAALNEWSIHKAIDFVASAGTNVIAAYDGTIESVTNNILDGTSITINHGNNLKTVYKSLDEDVKVKVGQTVKAGDVIALSSSSASGETTDSSQVHFEVWKEDKLVDPAGYLDLGEK